MSSIIVAGDTSGSVTLSAPAVAGSTVLTLPAVSGNVLTDQSSLNYTGFKNRIINGAMVIDQRNAGASGTGSSYTVDRWKYTGSQSSKGTVAQSTTVPAGFINSLGFTYSSTYSITASDFFFLAQCIEGYNVADLGWGTASAKTVTLSFQVYSSLTGTFGGVLTNGVNNRTYPFTYSVASANTWTTISVTVAGDTTGTWATDNTAGLFVLFGLGCGSTYSGTAGSWSGGTYFSATGATSVVGTNGATFYITGVQLEKGSTATSFDYRPYGTELQLCQRYFQIAPSAAPSGGFYNTTSAAYNYMFPVTMRAIPTVALPVAPYTNMVDQTGTGVRTPTSLAVLNSSVNSYSFLALGMSGVTLGNPSYWLGTPIQISTEL